MFFLSSQDEDKDGLDALIQRLTGLQEGHLTL